MPIRHFQQALRVGSETGVVEYPQGRDSGHSHYSPSLDWVDVLCGKFTGHKGMLAA